MVRIEDTIKITKQYSTSGSFISESESIQKYPSLKDTKVYKLVNQLRKDGIYINKDNSEKQIRDKNKRQVIVTFEESLPKGSLERLLLKSEFINIEIENINKSNSDGMAGGRSWYENGIKAKITYDGVDHGYGSELIDKTRNSIKKYYKK